MDIDVVITWVDGSDKAHQEKLKPYLKALGKTSSFVAGETRFGSDDEVYYCVASVIRFAPFVRKIYIVTDNQIPPVEEFIGTHFPNNTIPIEFVDHTVVYRGYEHYLPTFNSISISNVLHRIPGLSERFVYLNDDSFLVRPIKPSDWFLEDKMVAYGCWRPMWLDGLKKYLKPRKNGALDFGFKDTQITAGRAVGYRFRYFFHDHTPLPLLRSVVEEYYANHPEVFETNIKYRFRNLAQFNIQDIAYNYGLAKKKCMVESTKKFIFVRGSVKRKRQFEKKLERIDCDPNVLFVCIGSIDMASKEDQKRAISWLQKTILPTKQ